MARRKFVDGADELAHRFRQILQQRDPRDPKAWVARLASIAALASMWKIDLGPHFAAIIASEFKPRKNTVPVDFVDPETKMPDLPEESPAPPLPVGGGSILDEMGDN